MSESNYKATERSSWEGQGAFCKVESGATCQVL